MKRWHIFISIAAIAMLGFLLSQDALARLAWQKYRSPKAALLLVRSDEKLAMSIGNYYFNGQKYDLKKAERAYRKAVATDNKILWGHYQLARIHFLKGDYGRALEEINKELAANPENLRALYVRGLIYGYRAASGDLVLAEADFKRFVKWAPKEWAGYNDLAWVLAKQDKYLEAKSEVLGALREIPDAKNNPWIWNALGVSELNLGEYKDAEISFKKAKELAENLTIGDWRQAYPGNDPIQAESGLSAFRKAIDENTLRSNSNHVNNSL